MSNFIVKFMYLAFQKYSYYLLMLFLSFYYIAVALDFCIYCEVMSPYRGFVFIVLHRFRIMNHPTEKQRAFPSTECSEPCMSLYSQGGPLPRFYLF